MLKNSHLCTLLLTSLAFAGAAQAQANLTLTTAESGNFLVASPQSGAASNGGCSAYSPKYVNYPILSVNGTTGLKTLITSVPGRCVSTIQLFVKNLGNAATTGAITVTDTVLANEPKGATILNGGVGGGLTFSQNGYLCTIAPYMNSVSCTRAAGLAAGEEADLTLNVLMEDFNHNYDGPLAPAGARVGLNNTATVMGGPVDVTKFDSITYQAPLGDALTINPPVQREIFTVHSVPEGLTVIVDGEMIKTPHTYFYESDSVSLLHSIESPLPLCALNGGVSPCTVGFVAGQGITSNFILFGTNMFGGGSFQFTQFSPDVLVNGVSYGSFTMVTQ